MALQPRAVVLCGTRKGWFVCLTSFNTPSKSIPNDVAVLSEVIIVEDELPYKPDEPIDFSPVDEEHWPMVRNLINEKHQTYDKDLTFQQMLILGMKAYLDKKRDFEASAFPVTFPQGAGQYTAVRGGTPRSFKEYLKFQLSNSDRPADPRWECWAALIVKAIPHYYKAHPEDRRIFRFTHRRCAVCGAKAPKRCATCQWMRYCSQEHQLQDWEAHKAECTPRPN
eukprot:m.37027 g.37027  ORF g.37027 m.37027 type:complete len:224 (+) comp16151_c0_seq1:210-881(+)